MKRPSFRSARGARGYTAVEVLSALTLLAIGAAGVIGMQRVTLQGGEDARRFDIGNNIANEWLSRLQRDATQWTQPNDDFPQTSDLANTQWLNLVSGACSTGFCDPAAIGAAGLPGMSGSFDIFGRDVDPAGTNATYCAQYRLQWIAPPGVAPNMNPSAIMRTEVRVFWARYGLNPIGTCSSATPNAANAPTTYHFVYATSMVRENALRK